MGAKIQHKAWGIWCVHTRFILLFIILQLLFKEIKRLAETFSLLSHDPIE